MKTINERLKYLRDVLKLVSPNVYHYTAPPNKPTYIIWMEQGEDVAFYADNTKEANTLQVSVDLFTKTEYNPIIDNLCDELRKRGDVLSYKIDGVDYENETGYIHYQWTVYI